MNTKAKKQGFYNDPVLLAIGVASFLGAGVLGFSFEKPILEITKQQSATNVNSSLLEYGSAGNKRLFTDLLWIQTLLESDEEHYKNDDLNSWMYLRFKTIATLDPLFYENFNWGGRYLSIIKDDLKGAVEIYKLGLQNYSSDYKLNYGIGFTYYFELADQKSGLPFLEKIMKYPEAPPFFQSIVAKMKVAQNFDYDAALAFITNLINEAKDEKLKNKLFSDYYAVKAERDLICLNRGLKDCDYLDGRNEKYVLKGGNYHSRTPFQLYRLKKKGDLKRTMLVDTIK